jgi:hypothetical protein
LCLSGVSVIIIIMMIIRLVHIQNVLCHKEKNDSAAICKNSALLLFLHIAYTHALI